MRIIVTIAHYFKTGVGQGGYDRSHGSMAKDPRPRLQALSSCVSALNQLFAGRQCIIDIARKVALPASTALVGEVDVVICTTRGQHLLSDLRLPGGYYRYHATNAEPLLLGFECQAVLRDGLGRYDFYCYLEDDLILHDPWFFHKLVWFNRMVGDQNLLQPNRYEVGPHPQYRKAYIDGDMRSRATEHFQDPNQLRELSGRVMDVPVVFRQTLNPHSGCYFLNARQMQHWASQPHFLDRETNFIGPLESAATLGILRSFPVFKTAPECASFLEIQHAGTAFLGLIRPGGTIEPGGD